jgi:hypothetical protein
MSISMSPLQTGQRFIVGSMKGLTHSQYLLYSRAVSTFYRVHNYDLAIYAKRLAGVTGISYYVFADNTEETMYKMGQRILIQNDPVGALLFSDYRGSGGLQIFIYNDVFKI